MRYAGWHVQPLVRLRDRLAPFEAKAHPPAHHRERLLDGRVDVLSGEGTPGPDERINREQLATGVLGAYTDHHPLAGDRILYGVSCL